MGPGKAATDPGPRDTRDRSPQCPSRIVLPERSHDRAARVRRPRGLVGAHAGPRVRRVVASDRWARVIAMFVNAQEMLAFTYEGRQLRVPELGSWVEWDCTACGTHS